MILRREKPLPPVDNAWSERVLADPGSWREDAARYPDADAGLVSFYAGLPEELIEVVLAAPLSSVVEARVQLFSTGGLREGERAVVCAYDADYASNLVDGHNRFAAFMAIAWEQLGIADPKSWGLGLWVPGRVPYSCSVDGRLTARMVEDVSQVNVPFDLVRLVGHRRGFDRAAVEEYLRRAGRL